jgi:hypothetical protein
MTTAGHADPILFAADAACTRTNAFSAGVQPERSQAAAKRLAPASSKIEIRSVLRFGRSPGRNDQNADVRTSAVFPGQSPGPIVR